MAHRDAIRDRDRAELQRISTGCVHAILGCLGQPIEGQIARGDLVPTGGDPDLWLGPVLVTHTDRAEHATRPGGLEAIGDDPRPRLDVNTVRRSRLDLLAGKALLTHGGQSSRLARAVRLYPACA